MRGGFISTWSRPTTRWKTALWLLLFSWALSSPAVASSLRPFSTKYDAEIEQSARRWLPIYPSWKRGKAQLIQESQLDPNACSGVGACGLGQFMPGTWADAAKALNWGALPPRADAAKGIEAWAWYQGHLFQMWKAANRTVEDRVSLAEASYNAGAGNILKAQDRCGGPPGYDAIMACLESVTGDHWRETAGYTKSIRVIWKRLELGG